MREFLFRGKRTDNGEWAFGFFTESPSGNVYITETVCGGASPKTVDPDTVGQFTGLTDKNGKKIFEGDIVTAKDEIWGSPFCYGITGKIVYDEASFFIEPKDVMETQYLFNECAVYDVIGNIHDNPELLESP